MKEEKNYKIIEGIKKGNHKIISEFYKDNLPKIKNLILNNSGNEHDARDVFQDALVIVYKKIKANDLDIQCTLGTYIYAICKNLWLNKLRKQGKVINEDELKILDSPLSEDAVDHLDRMEKIAIVQKYCLKLGSGCRSILLLFYKGYTIREIAEIKSFTEGYTRKRKFACQKKLTEMVEKDPTFIELKESSNNW